jgi:hypothetical protein
MEKTGQRERGSRIYISGHPLDDYKFEMKYFVMLSSRSIEKSRTSCG